MPFEKNKQLFPLWNIGENRSIIILSRRGEDKFYSESELTWSDTRPNPAKFNEVLESLQECQTKIRLTHEATMKAIVEYQTNDQENNAKLPFLPKTPNPPKRTKKTIVKRRTKKVSTAQVIRRSARSNAAVTAHLIRDSLLRLSDPSRPEEEALVQLQVSSSNESKSSYDQPIRLRLSSMSDSSTDTPKTPLALKQVLVDRRSKESHDDMEQSSCNDEDLSLTAVISKDVSCLPESSQKSHSYVAESAEKSVSPTVLLQQSVVLKKASIKRKAKQSAAQPRSKRVTRHTRQTSQFMSLNEEQNSSDTEHSSPDRKDEESRNTKLDKENEIACLPKVASPSKSIVSSSLPEAEPVVKEPSAEENQSISSTPSGPRVSVTLRRLSSQEIQQHMSPSTDQVCGAVQNVKEQTEDMETDCRKSCSLTLSWNSDEETSDGGPAVVVESPRKSVARRRKSTLVLADGLAAKKRVARNKVMAKKKSLPKNQQLLSLKNADVGSGSYASSSTSGPEEPPDVEMRPVLAKPRIVKPVLRNKTAKPKTFHSAAKSRTRHQNSLVMSATPARTRSKLTTPLFRTPTSSSNIVSTVKSFLARNTPEPLNKEAIIEAKKKILEEKQRQGEERQRLIEEKKKQKLAEAKRKREERAMRAIRAREEREKEERERQDHIQDKWEQRIADADRTKSKRKLETTAKANKEMAKIAKAETKRKEEEEGKLRKFKEQEEEKEKRSQQQQAEKKIAEEMRLKEKFLEEQKRLDEERLKEEKLRQEEEERKRYKVEAAALKKKQEEEAKRKKQQEKLQKMRKKAEMEREAAKKLKQEERRLAKEEEEKRKAQEKREREEKIRHEKEEIAAAKERMMKAKQAEIEKERLILLEKEKAAKKLEAAKKKEQLRQRLEESKRLQLEKLKQDEENAQQARQMAYQKKMKEAEERINQLTAGPAQESLIHTPNPNLVPPNLNKTYLKDESTLNYDMTPRGPGKPLLPSTATNYNLDDFCSDDSTDDEDRPKKTVPKWAKGALLQSAIINQTLYPPDLDTIFPSLLDPVKLPLIFRKPKTRYYQRTSSAQWNSPVMPPGHISFTDQCKGFD